MKQQNLTVPIAILAAAIPWMPTWAHGQDQKPTQTAAAHSQPDPMGSSPSPAGPSYVIAPDDVLSIAVWKEDEISKTVPVRPDGKISLPLLNDVQAAGLTPSQLTTSLSEKLKKYIENPQVTVIVTQVNSQRVFLIGQVTRPGAYPVTPGMTVLQAISSAGGLVEFANGKKIYLMRTENGKPARYPFNYKDVVTGRKPEQNLAVKSGDTIVVP